MKLQELRGKIAIVGTGTFGGGESPGWSATELLSAAAHRAVADAGLRMQDIDGLATANLDSAMWPLNIVEALRLRPNYIESTNIGGSAFVSHLLPSMFALASGQCNAVLVSYGNNQRTATFARKERGRARMMLDPNPWEAPYAPVNPPSSYALIAARHMHQYGTTRRHLAEVAVAARKWAQRNPEAFARDPLSIEDVVKARMFSDPFSVHDCCLVTDGGAAFVMVRAERAKDLKKKPVYILGTATAATHRSVAEMPDCTVTPTALAAPRAYAMAGLGAKDMQMAQIYDAFTINTILALEDLGFCAKGEGGAFVSDGGIAPGGRLPVNTNGGGLSCVHPNMYGAFAVVEGVRQLQGVAGERQVPNAQTCVVNGNGGTSASSQAVAVLGTAATL